jgi:hypothetical protein
MQLLQLLQITQEISVSVSHHICCTASGATCGTAQTQILSICQGFCLLHLCIEATQMLTLINIKNKQPCPRIYCFSIRGLPRPEKKIEN